MAWNDNNTNVMVDRAGVAQLGDCEFDMVRGLVWNLSGIELAESKRGLVVGRLGRRLRQLGLHGYHEYCELLRGDRHGQERQTMLDLITTNETSFFREDRHFDELRRCVLPLFHRGGHLRAWSAACSSGEEVYSLAMVLDDELQDRYSILGTDISTRVLDAARNAVYPLENASRIPTEYLNRYCLRGINNHSGSFRITSALRHKAEFRQINLNGDWPDLGRFNVIFLRNVMIYFNRDTKKRLIARMAAQLAPGGFLFLGHSETINGLHDGFVTVCPAVYRLRM